MSVLQFDNNLRRQVKQVIAFAQENIYVTDDLLDMMNGELDVPGEQSEHQILAPQGRWICYYLVDHPLKGMCHYFQIKPNYIGKLPDKAELEYILKEFEIGIPLQDEHIKIDEKEGEVKIILPKG